MACFTMIESCSHWKLVGAFRPPSRPDDPTPRTRLKYTLTMSTKTLCEKGDSPEDGRTVTAEINADGIITNLTKCSKRFHSATAAQRPPCIVVQCDANCNVPLDASGTPGSDANAGEVVSGMDCSPEKQNNGSLGDSWWDAYSNDAYGVPYDSDKPTKFRCERANRALWHEAFGAWWCLDGNGNGLQGSPAPEKETGLLRTNSGKWFGILF